MKPRLSVLTLCVDDLERSLRFYRDGLGLRTPGVIGQEFEHGAVVVKTARKTFWGGYSGYFQDPDGHLWEIVWNPHLLPED
jgi:uncharacterized protein